MVNRDELRRGGLRAYEIGRLRAAVRAAWVLVPTALVCAFETGAGEACACVGSLLLGVSIFLRWRDRRGAHSVRDGLIAGLLPLIVGLLVNHFAPGCANAQLFSWCVAACLGAGLPSGAWLGVRLVRGAGTKATWFAAGGIALLTAMLGCAGLGITGIIGAAIGLAVGAISVQAFARIAK